jgi:hypothetical protein
LSGPGEPGQLINLATFARSLAFRDTPLVEADATLDEEEDEGGRRRAAGPS